MTTFERKLVLLLCAFSLILAAITLSGPAKADNNWCGDFADGYVVGYCWKDSRCAYVPPVMCPYPEDGQEDGYMVGLMSGLDDARKAE